MRRRTIRGLWLLVTALTVVFLKEISVVTRPALTGGNSWLIIRNQQSPAVSLSLNDTSINSAIRTDPSVASPDVVEKGSSIPREPKENVRADTSNKTSRPLIVGNRTAPTIVCQLKGEMANNLSFLCQASIISLLLKDLQGINAKIVLRSQQERRIWANVRDGIQKCFPYWRNYNFEGANTDEFDSKLTEMQTNHSLEAEILLNEINKPGKMLQSLQYAANRTYHFQKGDTISMPFIYSQKMTGPHSSLIDTYYQEIRHDWFRFEREACCNLKPDPDESVFVSSLNVP